VLVAGVNLLSPDTLTKYFTASHTALLNPQGFAAVIMTLFAKHSWRRGDRDSALKLVKWARYVAIASIILGIITLVTTLGYTRAGRYNNGHRNNNGRDNDDRYDNDRDCHYYGNC
jgi:hypothetical protein